MGISRLMVSGAVAALVAHVAAAQTVAGETQQAGAAEQGTDIVITGSRLRRSDTTAATPVTVLSGAQLEATGRVSLLDQLRTDPAIGTASRGTNFTIGGGGLERIDLRNVGNTRTLVLVNGHRYPFFSDVRGNSGQDVGTIPNAAIGRIDILRDGASALYGADAVAGVVNFVTDTRFDGIEADVYSGISVQGDLPSQRAYVKFGKTFDRGSVTLTASWQHQAPLPQSNRDFATNLIGVGGIQAGQTLIGSVAGPGGRVTSTSGALVACYPLQGGPALAPGTACPRYDSSAEPSLLGGKKVYGGSAAIRYDLTDGVRLVADGIYSRRDSRQLVGAQSLSSVRIAATNSNNPYGQTVLITDRLTDYGVRRFRGRSELFFGTAGLEGRIADRFDWSVTHTYGRTDSDLATSNIINLGSATALLNPQTCAATAACAGVGPITNVAAFLSKATPLTAAQQGYLFYTERAKVRFTSAQTIAQVSGRLFDLPAGPLQAVVGGEYRREAGSIRPDALSFAGASGSALAATRGSFNAKEAFAEFNVPILKNSVVARALDADLVYRFSNFSNFSNAHTWKAGLNWTVTPDIRLRGSIGRSFRAPNILDLYTGRLQVTTNLADPCNAGPQRTGTVAANCAALGVPATYIQTSSTLPAETGGNPNLKPERGMSYNLGAVLTPRFAPGLSVTVDWWRLKITNAIDNRLQDNLNACYQDANFRARAANPTDICYTFADRQSDGSLTRVASLSTNFAKLTTSGIDANIAYTQRNLLGGDWTTRLALSYLDNYDDGSGNTAGTFNELVIGASLPRWRFREELGYATSRFQLRGAANFVSGMRDRNLDGGLFTVPNAKGYDGKTPSYVTFDLFGKIRVGSQMDLTLGVNNIADRKPPYAYSTLYNTLITTYDVIGRYLYVDARVRF